MTQKYQRRKIKMKFRNLKLKMMSLFTRFKIYSSRLSISRASIETTRTCSTGESVVRIGTTTGKDLELPT